MDANSKKRKLDLYNVDLLSSVTLTPNPQTGLISRKDFESIYQKYQVVYLPSMKINDLDTTFQWENMSTLFSKLNEKDQSSWTVEKVTRDYTVAQTCDDNDNNESKERLKPLDFLSSSVEPTHITKAKSKTGRGYASFIVQHDKDAMNDLMTSLPMIHLPIANEKCVAKDNDSKDPLDLMKMKYSPCIWFFYGRNDALAPSNCGKEKKITQKSLAGRPEHTDSIAHHGTWHYQLSGVKEWNLRPTEELGNQINAASSFEKNEEQLWKNSDKSEEPSMKKITISCKRGDVLLVNTRLWWHSTTIPEQPLATCNEKDSIQRSIPSVSYARDIYLTWDDDDDNANDSDIIQGNGDNMTNLDGLYARTDVGAGTIVFTEDDMPDCELHRTRENANCEVVELEDGSGAVVSCRDIKSGEFFCILESDDEEEEEEEDDDDRLEFDDDE
jgi:U3 small nucleolar RNA-associated protein 6